MISPKAVGRASLLLASVLPWVCLAGATAGDDPRSWNLTQWESWRDDQIRKILTPTFEVGNEKILARSVVIDKASDAYLFLTPLLKDPAFLGDAERAKALSNFVRFTKAQHWMAIQDSSRTATHAVGMEISDREYWSWASPYLGFPELLQSQSFLKCLSSPAGYQAGVEMIEANNSGLAADQKWGVYLYRSQFLKSVDLTSYGRLLVVVPNTRLADGKIWDRWIQFALATPDLHPVPVVKSVSMIATVRDAGLPGVSQGFSADFMRKTDESTGSITMVPNFFTNPGLSKNCYDCHKSAVLPIHPKIAYRFDAQGLLVADSAQAPSALNALISRYGRCDLGHEDSDAYGPSVAPVGKDRSDSFISDATESAPLPYLSYNSIRANMICSSCHNGFAPLNFMAGARTDRDVKIFESGRGLVQTYIENGYMPPGNTLSPSERHALWQCVSKEYFEPGAQRGILVDWLRGR